MHTNQHGTRTINFFDPQAVKALNTALLYTHYKLQYWDIPEGYLCPPIPGRADYIHHAADLLARANKGKTPRGHQLQCLDIGTGANCIYPILANSIYHWQCTSSDIDQQALASARKIIDSNQQLKKHVELRQQNNAQHILQGIISPKDTFDLTICNPPFHSSKADATAGSLRKLSNLKKKKVSKAQLNFAGQSNELYCPGGEKAFVSQYIQESKNYATQVLWFSSLISKKDNLPTLYKALKAVKAQQVETIPMGQGNKQSRILAWSFLSSKQQISWAQFRWK